MRALAVLAIFAFHLDLAGFDGGFVGVDIFFVISGFVITRGLLLDLERNRFSLQQFYIRRARRILPAMAVVLASALVAGFVILSPGELREFAESALASLFSVANFFFHDRTNYFADTAHSRPLLHMWSLSVEEQFYLLFPLGLSLLVQRGGIGAAKAIASMTTLSFGYCVVSGVYSENHAFYMPMARFWEIGVGALVAAAEARGLVISYARAVGAVGLGVIIATVALLDGQAAPWMMALPVLAAAAVIGSGACAGGPVFRILSARPVVAVGRLSYSIYLIHWPVIVYWRMNIARPLLPMDQAWIFLVTILLAALLWRFVENPFRSGGGLPNVRALKPIAAPFAAVVVLAFAARREADVHWRLNVPAQEAVAQLQASIDKRPRCSVDRDWLRGAPRTARACRWPQELNEGSDFIILGDSHAAALAPELAQMLLRSARMTSGLLVSKPGCPPVYGVHLRGRKINKDCAQYVASLFDAIERHRPKLIIFVGRWANLESDVRSPGDGGGPSHLVDSASGKDMSLADALARTLRRLASYGERVVLVGPVPEIEFDVPATLVRALRGFSHLPPVLQADFERRQRLVIDALARVGSTGNVTVLYPHLALCDGRTCDVVDGLHALYSDDDHLSPFGAARVARAFEPVLAGSIRTPTRD